MRLVQDAEVANKKVFLRVDFNVPVKDGVITDNNRIKAAIPTIKHLVESRAKVIIGTHLGRPDGVPSAETSVGPAAKELERLLNLKVELAPAVIGPEVAQMVEELPAGGILMLENLRWDKREEENDPGFAQELSTYADLYVNDAFAVSHRANASVEALPRLLPSYAGLLMESEVTSLEMFLQDPAHPFVMIIGGVKVKDKAGMIDKLAPIADRILIGGGVANTFLKAKADDISASVYDEEMVEACKGMLEKYYNKIVLPTDYIKEELADGGFKIMDIGEKSREVFTHEISEAKTVLWNGNLGYTEDPKYRGGGREVAKAMAELHETTVVAGGDTVGFIKEEGLDQGISFISTGGGAALEFLAGEKLPGIEVLN